MTGIHDIINRQILDWDRLQASLRKGEWEEEGKEAVAPKTAIKPVVAFSPALGCGSRRVAEILSEKTGYGIFGWSIIDKIAEDIDVQRKIVDRLDENALSQIDILVEGLLWGRYVDREEYLRSLLRVIRAFIVQGGVILIGRGAVFVADSSEAIRVRLIAPMEMRVENLMRYYGISDKTARERIRESDKRRAYYAQTFFKKDIKDPENYDLVINLGTVKAETAADIILSAVERFGEDKQGRYK